MSLCMIALTFNSNRANSAAPLPVISHRHKQAKSRNNNAYYNLD